MPPLVAPSLLSSDFSKLKQELKALQKAGADWIHFDIMDSQFVPQLTFGPLVLKSLRPLSSLPFDAHLMVSQPEKFIKPLAEAGANYITFHLEAQPKPQKLLQAIRKLNIKAGLSIKPKTPVTALFPFLQNLDLILIMTVEPGKSGQAFLKEPAKKIEILRQKLSTFKKAPLIEVDGGLNPKTTPYVKGADVLVSGNYILKSKNYSQSIARLKNTNGFGQSLS